MNSDILANLTSSESVLARVSLANGNDLVLLNLECTGRHITAGVVVSESGQLRILEVERGSKHFNINSSMAIRRSIGDWEYFHFGRPDRGFTEVYPKAYKAFKACIREVTQKVAVSISVEI